MYGSEMSIRRVIRIGDIAGSGAQLARAMSLHTDWSVDHIPAPEFGAGRGGVVGAMAMPVRIVDLATRVSGRVRSSGATIAHLHWARYAPFVFSGSIPMVVHAHGSDVRGRLHGTAATMVTRSLERAGAVIVSTPDLLDHVPTGAIHLPSPIDGEFWFDEPGDHTGTEGPTILIHARLTPIKGAEALLAAADKILQSRPEANVLAFGGTRLDEEARSIGVEILPFGDAAAVRDVLRRSHVVIGQHRLLAVGLSELQAMASQRPVVMPLDRSLYSKDIPVVTTSGIDETVEACLDLLDDPASRSSIGAAGRRYVMDRHDLPVVARALTGIYEAVLHH